MCVYVYIYIYLCVCVCVYTHARASECQVASVTPNSLWPHGLQPIRLLGPRDSPGRNTGVGGHAFFRGVSPTQGSNPCPLHWRQTLYCWATEEGKYIYIYTNTHTHVCMYIYGKVNGNPLQYSSLGIPTDRGAWWVTVHGVAKESDMT